MTLELSARRTRTTAVLGLLLAALIASGSVAVPASATAALADQTNVLNTWAYANESPPPVTKESAIRTALDHDVIIALPGTYKAYVSDMKAANPKLRLHVYMNAAYAQKTQGTAFPESWYARTATGSKIQSHGYGNYLMNAAHTGWQQARVDHALTVLRSSGYDGVFLDMLGIASVDPSYTTGVPVNPVTGKAWSAKEWLAATNDVARVVGAGTGRPVSGNGAGNGPRFYHPDAPTSILMGNTQMLMSEIWLRPAGASLTWFPTETRWKQSVDMLAEGQTTGETHLVMVKLWPTGTQTEKDRWHEFGLASFLLGTDGRARFSATFAPKADHTVEHPWWTTQIGSPQGTYVKSGTTYRRTFSNGLVLVNPSTATVTVPLDRLYRTLDGRTVTSVTMVGQRGVVLTNA